MDSVLQERQEFITYFKSRSVTLASGTLVYTCRPAVGLLSSMHCVLTGLSAKSMNLRVSNSCSQTFPVGLAQC